MTLTSDATKFANDLSAATHIPVAVVSAWIECESAGGKSLAAPYNFLNYGNPSAVFPSVGVAVSTCANEINSGPYYVGLRAAIATGDSSTIVEAIVESPWAEGHYGAPLTPGGGNDPRTGYARRDYRQSCILKSWDQSVGATGAVEDVTPGIPDITDPIQTLIDLFNGIGHFFSILTTRSTWVRIGEILGGAILIGVAIMMTNKDIYKTAKTVAKVAAIA